MKTIGERIRSIRLLRNLSQENIAEDLKNQKIKMGQQGFSKIERGDRDVKFSQLQAIAKTLGMNVEDIVAFDDKVVFNIHHNKDSNNGLVINNHTEPKVNKQEIENQIEALRKKIIDIERKLDEK
jgi:transcriptional regulator with XRE-family HTH domain